MVFSFVSLNACDIVAFTLQVSSKERETKQKKKTKYNKLPETIKSLPEKCGKLETVLYWRSTLKIKKNKICFLFRTWTKKNYFFFLVNGFPGNVPKKKPDSEITSSKRHENKIRYSLFLSHKKWSKKKFVQLIECINGQSRIVPVLVIVQ